MSIAEVRGDLVEVNRQLGEFTARLAAIDHEMSATQRIANGVLDTTGHEIAMSALESLAGSFAALHDTLGGIRMAREKFADYIEHLGRLGGGRA
ncbi:MAG TPA: hypothetical protein VFQ06_01495 [Nitrospira sp.]|nr:hypothetical protein [Nitrospira sp.]